MSSEKMHIDSLFYNVSAQDDEVAFRKLFDRLYAPLVQYSAYIVGNVAFAEEIVSEVFVKLWQNRKKVEIRNLKKYLYTVTKHRTIDFVRQAKNLTFISFDKKDLKECVVFDNPENKYLETELRQKLEEAILKLPEKCRLIYRLVKEENMRYHEAAELLDISPKTVENQMTIAIRRIREETLKYLSAGKKAKSKISIALSFLF